MNLDLGAVLTTGEVQRLTRFVREIERLKVPGLEGSRIVRGLVKLAVLQAELRGTADNVAVLRSVTGGS